MSEIAGRAAAPVVGPRPRSRGWAVFYALLTAGLVALFCAFTATIAWRRLIYAPYAGLWLLRLLGVGLLFAAALTFAATLRELGAAPRVAWAERLGRGWRRRCALIIAAALLASLALVWVLRAFPNSGDEYAYLWLARTFLAGRLWNPPPPIPDLFQLNQTGLFAGRWVTLYNPGWPALLAAGIAAGLPASLICPLVGGLLLALVAILGRRRDGPLGAVLATALVAASPFFLFNAASYFTEVPAAAAGLLFCWRACVFLDRPGLAAAALCGAALGVLGLIRAAEVPIFALPFAVEFACRARARHYRPAAAIGVAGLPFLAVLMGYYRLTIGAFVPPFPSFAGAPAAGATAASVAPGFAAGAEHQLLLAASRLLALAEWTSPLLALGAAAALAALTARRRLGFIDLVFPAFVIAYLFVPFDGGNQYGPRYYFDGFPCLVLSLVSWLAPLLRDRLRPQRASFACSALIAHIAICAIVLGFLCVDLRRVVDQRMDLYDQVRQRHLHAAVVVIRSPTSSIYRMVPQDLVRDGIDARGDVVYVLDRPNRLAALRSLYPARRFYVYERAELAPTGVLRPLPLPGQGGR